ncbi:DUF6931 family protein [Glacieibacterium megasporae]|uniref:DUF6931 family protein n=1 Tax=Glacieibacterium megasporae TaxID=2835787 RepID=UPI001C1DE71C|nr:hypothetical protein [Polymorphobacter megasporae]UAJ09822.1 hypothetical protein KTC28_16235 [Polymorphobacter megasporae]
MSNADAATVPRAWRRVKWTRAGQVAAVLDGLVDLAALYDQPPPQAFAALRQVDLSQAARFLAQCLPRMEAIRWVSACLNTMPASGQPERLVAKKAVNRWLADPSDTNRRIAYEAGQIVGWASAEGAACLSVFLSGGSIAPQAQEQGVAPAPGAFGQAVAGAVLMTAFGEGAVAFDQRLAANIDLGEKAAAGEALQG